MRKPNYLQIKLNTGRVQEEFMIPYACFEKSLFEIYEIIESVQRSKHFDHETKDILKLFLLHLSRVEQRNNELIDLF